MEHIPDVSKNNKGNKDERQDSISDKRISYLHRRSITSDMLPEEQSRNNDIFSPKPVNDTKARRTLFENSEETSRVELMNTPVDNDSAISKSEIEEWFSLDDSFGYTDDQLFKEGLPCIDCFCSIRNLLENLPVPPTRHSRLLLPEKLSTAHSHTLVLDLDETLVSCALENPGKYDTYFVSHQISKSTGEKEEYYVYVRFRPYVFMFLEEMSKYYELIVFTAAEKTYAHKIVELFNEDKELISFCLTREHTTFIRSDEYYKDLLLLNRDMNTTFIIDNTPQVYCYNVNNAIPILSWYGDEEDKELFSLTEMLRQISYEDDVRPAIKETFQIENLLKNHAIIEE